MKAIGRGLLGRRAELIGLDRISAVYLIEEDFMTDKRPRGRPPIPVYIDGEKFDSKGQACEELGCRLSTLKNALATDCMIRGHHVALEPGAVPPAPLPVGPPRKRTVSVPARLLPATCTHRLGTYNGGAV
jgi:hypothetical protein